MVGCMRMGWVYAGRKGSSLVAACCALTNLSRVRPESTFEMAQIVQEKAKMSRERKR